MTDHQEQIDGITRLLTDSDTRQRGVFCAECDPSRYPSPLEAREARELCSHPDALTRQQAARFRQVRGAMPYGGAFHLRSDRNVYGWTHQALTVDDVLELCEALIPVLQQASAEADLTRRRLAQHRDAVRGFRWLMAGRELDPLIDGTVG